MLQIKFRQILKSISTQFTWSPKKQSSLSYVSFDVSQKHFLDLEYTLSFIDLAK